MALADTIQTALGRNPEDFLVDERRIQAMLAGELRRKAIEHLGTANTPVAEGFRGEYINAGQHLHGNPPHVEEFLAQQSQDGAWGTYIEAEALGEALGCHVVVTDISGDKVRKPYCLYNAGDNKAEILHLTLENNRHWSVNNNTRGDGNCLYNAFAQALRQHIVDQHQAEHQDTQPLAAEIAAVETQKTALLAVICKQPSPEEREQALADEKRRIESLPPEERTQIAEDHKLALKLALEELEPQPDAKSRPEAGPTLK